MLQIRNISIGKPSETRVAERTNWGAGTAAFPLFFDLSPGQTLEVPQTSVHAWDPGVKQWLAEYMAHNILAVYEVTTSHLYQDKGNDPVYSVDHLIDAKFDPLATTHAIEIATTLHTAMNDHFENTRAHNAATTLIGAAVPTDLATLITWITEAQTRYDTDHRPAIAAHPVIDLVNTLALGAPATLAQCIAALRELYIAYDNHKTWFVGGTELDIEAVLAY